jgi:hypothetical protein
MQRLLGLLAGLLALSSLGGAAEAAAYKTARGLFRDCAVEQSARRQHCADYLAQLLDDWNLNQDNGVCSRHVGSELPDAYVQYWRGRGLGGLAGEFRSAEASVNEFLDSQRQPCPAEKPH